jgi:pilus assembly protein CpaE
MKAAAVTTDAQFRDRLDSLMSELRERLDLELVIESAYRDVGDPELDRLRRLQPAVTFLDLDSDPEVGLRFARFLMDSELTGAVVGVGGDLSADFLLKAMKSGMADIVPKPVTVDAMDDALERIWQKPAWPPAGGAEEEESELGKLITAFSAKGGSGSTTFAVNLAVEIRRLTGGETALVDLDLELGETALLLGVDPRFSIVDLLRNFHRIDSDLLASYIERHDSGVELLSAPYQPVDYETVSEDRIRQILDFLREHYDYIVVDAPKTFNPTTLGTFEDTDLLLLVTTADLPSLRNVTRSLPLLNSLSEGKGDDWIRLVLNRYEENQAITVADIEETLDLEVRWTLANDYLSVIQSINEGEPVVLRGGSDYADDVRRVAGALTGVDVDVGRQNFLDSLLGFFRGGKDSGDATSEREALAQEVARAEAARLEDESPRIDGAGEGIP